MKERSRLQTIIRNSFDAYIKIMYILKMPFLNWHCTRIFEWLQPLVAFKTIVNVVLILYNVSTNTQFLIIVHSSYRLSPDLKAMKAESGAPGQLHDCQGNLKLDWLEMNLQWKKGEDKHLHLLDIDEVEMG